MARVPKLKRAVALTSLLALTAVAVAPAAVAGNGTISSLSERQSVKTELSPDGKVRSSRLYTQILAEGEGTVELAVPTSTKGLRNLEGFTKPAISADAAVWNLTLPKGQPVSRRTVSDFDRELPVSIEATYTLDGKDIKPSDLVGKSGLVTATYTVKNLTAKPTEIEIKDGLGNKSTETVDVVVPLAGSFSTTLDGRFTALDAPTAVQAGDGRGNTALNWSLLLFEPLGSNVSTMSWSAYVTDAIVPAAKAQIVPVVADGSPLDSGIANFGDAVNQTTALTQGSSEIDRNTIRVHTGAVQLLDGVTKLADGSRALADGLDGAASGSGELADGAGQLADGAGAAAAGGKKLASGLGDLSSGAGQLSAGLFSARDGGTKLSAGLGDLSAGAGQLSAGLGSASEGGTKLSAGLGDLSAGAGELSAGLGSASEGGQKLVAGATATQEGAAKAADSSAQIAAGARQLEAGLKDLADAADKLPALAAGIEAYRAQALGGIGAAIGTPGSTFGGDTPSVRTIIASVKPGLDSGSTDLAQAAADARTDGAQLSGLVQVQINTVTNARTALLCGEEGELSAAACGALAALLGGATPPSLHITKGAFDTLAGSKADSLDEASTKLAAGAAGLAGAEQILAGLHHSVTNKEGSAQLGLDSLQDGVTKLRDGVRTSAAASAGTIAGFQEDLSEGLDFLAGDEALGAVKKGAGDLAGGLVQLDEGAGKLAAGATAAAAGSQELVGGINQLADGGRKLSDGASAAAAGSKELVGGINQLADGGRKLADGSKTAASGAGELATGLGKLNDGSRKLADGAYKLSDGLAGAATGSLTIADGLQMAKLGNTNLVNGAEQLSAKGTSVLADEVNEATMEQARKVATLRAASERAKAEGLPYPGAEGALATGVYSLELASAEGATSDTTTRVALAFLVLAAMGAGAAFTRKTAKVVAG